MKILGNFNQVKSIKIISLILFIILFIIFTSIYISFFPGAFSPDSYYMYLQSLDKVQFLAELVPLYSTLWKIFGNYNFGPFVINYVLVLLGIIISYKKTKSFSIPIIVLIFFMIPSFLSTYIYQWKDNILVSILFVLFSLLLENENQNSVKISTNKFYISNFIIWLMLFFATNIRLNAMSATLPLIYYMLRKNSNAILSILKSFLILVVFVAVNNIIVNRYIYNARELHFYQTTMLSDILKINFTGHLNIQIPQSFTSPDYNYKNIDNIMHIYNNFPCNDIFYNVYNNNPPILITTSKMEEIQKLKIVWIRTVLTHPIIYFRVKIYQLITSILSLNIPEYSAFNSNEFNKYTDKYPKSMEYKFLLNNNNQILVNIRNLYKHLLDISHNSHCFLYYLSNVGLWLTIEAFMLILVILFRDKIQQANFLITTLLSGLFYSICYLPVLTCTDYRYFLWSCCALALSLGKILSSIGNKLKR